MSNRNGAEAHSCSSSAQSQMVLWAEVVVAPESLIEDWNHRRLTTAKISIGLRQTQTRMSIHPETIGCLLCHPDQSLFRNHFGWPAVQVWIQDVCIFRSYFHNSQQHRSQWERGAGWPRRRECKYKFRTTVVRLRVRNEHNCFKLVFAPSVSAEHPHRLLNMVCVFWFCLVWTGEGESLRISSGNNGKWMSSEDWVGSLIRSATERWIEGILSQFWWIEARDRRRDQMNGWRRERHVIYLRMNIKCLANCWRVDSSAPTHVIRYYSGFCSSAIFPLSDA